MKLEFSDGTTFIADKDSDDFFMAFNENLILRESCYNCYYCGNERIADFTIGDFWGVSDRRANEDDKKSGISLLLVNSNKGKQIFQSLNDYLVITAISEDEAVPYNGALLQPNHRQTLRDMVEEKIIREGCDFAQIINRLLWKKKLKAKAKGVLGERVVLFIKRLRRRNHERRCG